MAVQTLAVVAIRVLLQVGSFEYLILDEVHCMNERGGGEIWERIMLAAR